MICLLSCCATGRPYEGPSYLFSCPRDIGCFSWSRLRKGTSKRNFGRKILFFSICKWRLRLRTGISCLEKRFWLWVSIGHFFSRRQAKSASLANKALLFVEAHRPIAPCSGTSALSAFVKRFTPTELYKLFPRLPFGPEKLALT